MHRVTHCTYALLSGFDALKLKTVSLDVSPVERRRQQQVVDLMAARTVRPGEDLNLTVVMEGENGVDIRAAYSICVPVGTPAGTLNFTIADATSTNVTCTQSAVATPRSVRRNRC